MKIKNIGTKSLHTSSPGDAVQGYIDVQNDYPSLTADVFWGYGTFDSGTGNFSIVASALEENISFSGYSSIRHETFAFATPNDPGTWDLIGIIADDIYWDGNDLVIVKQHDTAVFSENAWTISVGAAELQVLNVGVLGA